MLNELFPAVTINVQGKSLVIYPIEYMLKIQDNFVAYLTKFDKK